MQERADMFVQKLVEVDSYIIERLLEPLMWRIEYCTGRNNFWCARMVSVLYPAGLIMSVMSEPSAWGWWHALMMVPLFLVLLWAGISLYFGTLADEQMQKPGLMNPRRREWAARYFMVTFALIFVVLRIIDVFWTIGMTAYCVQLYLRACSPMPPKWQQERKEKSEARALAAQTL